MRRPYKQPRSCSGASWNTSPGKAFPWTEERLKAVAELARALELTEEERAEVVEDLGDIAAQSPRTTAAEARFGKIIKRAGAEAKVLLYEVTANLIAEGIRRRLFPGL